MSLAHQVVSVCVCLRASFGMMRHDKCLHPPLRHSIPQCSATRSVWHVFHLSTVGSLLLLLFSFPFPCSSSSLSQVEKGKWGNERDKILIRGGGRDKSTGITKGSDDNTCKTQIPYLRERLGGGGLGGSLIFFPPYSEA